MTCAAVRDGRSGQWGCSRCQATWDDGDEPPCQSNVPEAYDTLHAPEQRFPLPDYKNDPVAYMSLLAAADGLGYKLPPKTRQYLDLLDKTYGPQKRN